MDQWAKHFSALPMGASARDQSTSMDELGRKVYRSPTGQQYSFPMEGEGGQRGSVVRAAAEDPKGALSSIVNALLGGVGSAISAPGRAAMGQPVTNGDVWSTGGMAQLAAMPMQAPEGALRSGAMGSTRAADDVLGMLKSGRAAEVTDDMMAAADPQYLYQNYDLPMDAASRMGRAQDMGMTFDSYHGSGDISNIRELRPSVGGEIGPGVYHTRSPEYAGQYAIKRNSEGDVMQSPRGIIPLKVAEPKMMDRNAWLDARGQHMDDIRAERGGEWSPDIPNLAQDRLSNEIGGNVYFNGGGFNEQGAVTNAANMRSRFARFDPRLSHLKNLNAAAAPVAMGSLAAMPQSDKEEIRKYLGMIY